MMDVLLKNNEICGICNSQNTTLKSKKVNIKNTEFEYYLYFIECNDCKFRFVNEESEIKTTHSRRNARIWRMM